MTRLPSHLAVVCTLFTFAFDHDGNAWAQEIEKTPPVQGSPSKSGEAQGPTATRVGRFLIGDPAPDIEIKDEDGKTFELSAERRSRPVLIGFARQPEDAVELERARAVLESANIGAVVIAPFHRDRVSDVAGTPKITFVNDRSARFARLYGLFDAVTSTPQPGAILVDERQRIRLIVSGIMPAGNELARNAIEAIEKARAGKVADQ
jgi:peroxiredoxin